MLGYSPLIKTSLEYNVNSFTLFDIDQSTYLTLGTSMFGIANGIYAYSSPIVGANQVIGSDFAFEIGGSYFRQYKSDSDLSSSISSIYELDNYDAIGFNAGFRSYSGNFLIRVNYTPFYNLTDNEFRNSLSFSFGWSF